MYVLLIFTPGKIPILTHSFEKRVVQPPPPPPPPHQCVCHFPPWEPRIFQEPSWELQPGQRQIFRMVKEGLDAAKAAGRDGRGPVSNPPPMPTPALVRPLTKGSGWLDVVDVVSDPFILTK